MKFISWDLELIKIIIPPNNPNELKVQYTFVLLFASKYLQYEIINPGKNKEWIDSQLHLLYKSYSNKYGT
jgi:hypothetical protein